MRLERFEQFWVMRDGNAAKYGSLGNEESASYRAADPTVSSNLTLTAMNPKQP